MRQALPLSAPNSEADLEPAPLPYVVARATGDLDELSRIVSKLMELGYAPIGTLVVAACFDRSGAFIVDYYQPMVRPRAPITFQGART